MRISWCARRLYVVIERWRMEADLCRFHSFCSVLTIEHHRRACIGVVRRFLGSFKSIHELHGKSSSCGTSRTSGSVLWTSWFLLYDNNETQWIQLRANYCGHFCCHFCCRKYLNSNQRVPVKLASYHLIVYSMVSNSLAPSHQTSCSFGWPIHRTRKIEEQ